MGKVINIGDSVQPHIDVFYKDTYLLLHQDLLEILLKNEDFSNDDLSLLSRLKSELKLIVDDMTLSELPEIHDEFQYEKYIFYITFSAELYKNKTTLIPIVFDSSVTILALNEDEANEELNFLRFNPKKLLSNIDFTKISNIKITNPEFENENISTLKTALLKDINVDSINDLKIIPND